jgi:effector-binding domain-containing protein
MCTLKRQHTAVVRGAMPAADLPGWLPGVFHAVADHLERADAVVAGPAFACIELRPGDDRRLGDLRTAAGFPVAEPITGDGWVRPSALPAGPAAVATHLGPCEAVETACAELDAWLAGRGLLPDGVRWEVYLTDPATEPDPAHWLSQLVVPYRPAAA